MNYRHEAALHLDAAKNEVDTGDDFRLKYASLELRMAMEGLTYDRALAYKDEFPPNEYQTWQPRKIMAVLLEIDSSADADTSIAIGHEVAYRVPAPEIQALGTDDVLNMATLRRHYDALGSYLHLPSIKQIKAGGAVDFARMRQRCNEIIGEVDKSLSSPIFNITLGEFARFECDRCQQVVRKRLSRDNASMIAECFQCNATYTLSMQTNGKVEIRPNRQDLKCGLDSCVGEIHLWEADLKTGTYWRCDVCGGRNVITLAQYYEASR